MAGAVWRARCSCALLEAMQIGRQPLSWGVKLPDPIGDLLDQGWAHYPSFVAPCELLRVFTAVNTLHQLE